MASAPTQLLLRRLLKSGGPSTVHGRSAMHLEPPSVNDRIEEMNAQLRALEVQLGHKGQDPKAAVQDLEYHKMYQLSYECCVAYRAWLQLSSHCHTKPDVMPASHVW
ncbi:hypothetical protein CDV31_015113 [Fusarium ambrosium]|uniref:Uncharacterized protein n=1 Tax=Fusarium ambrosium TaxID=131363 RepID=A0A428SRV4_9HYPO|nr:hypothetical protein CDV31_015113 [Fusarium ambrosium]